MPADVTVLMTTYNGERYIAKAIDSVLRQSYRNFELRIVDDASTDATVSIVNNYKDTRIRLGLLPVNVGQVKALQHGLNSITTQYVARLDHDDMMTPQRLQVQLDILAAAPNLVAVGSWERIIDQHNTLVAVWQPSTKLNQQRWRLLFTLALGRVPFSHPSVMFRTLQARQVGGYDARFPLAEDYNLWVRMALQGWGMAVVPQYLTHRRVHSQQQSKTARRVQWNSMVHARWLLWRHLLHL